MTNNDILATFKKHIEGINNNETKNMTKSQIYRFSENIKGINEFIGASQTILIKISKIKNIAEKIQYLDELLESQSNDLYELEQNKQSNINEIKNIVKNANFIGISLFDTTLFCNINGKEITLDIQNPINYIDNGLINFCQEIQNEINKTLVKISNLISIDSDIENNINKNTCDKNINNIFINR